MINEHLVLFALWLAYCLLHSVLAASVVKDFTHGITGLGPLTYRAVYNIFAFITIVYLLFLQWKTASPLLFMPRLYTKIPGLFFCTVGATIMGVCIYHYFKQLSGVFEESRQPTLRTTGLHALVRHPLYLGTIIFLFGLVILFPRVSNLGTVFIIVTYTIAGTRYEELKLVKQFGKSYGDYQQRIPAIFPRIRFNRKQKVPPQVRRN